MPVSGNWLAWERMKSYFIAVPWRSTPSLFLNVALLRYPRQLALETRDLRILISMLATGHRKRELARADRLGLHMQS